MPYWDWSPVFDANGAAVFASALLYFVAAISLLTYLGAGLSALVLPSRLRCLGWLVAPYLGYSMLVTLCTLVVSIGGNVAISLAIALALATAANGWGLLGNREGRSLGDSRWWLLWPCLALPSYLITAVSMAHAGTLGYVGPSSDPIWLMRLAEWFKYHPAPLFSAGASSPLDPLWNANFPPLDGWFAPDARMGYELDPSEETYFMMQRGPRYLESALGLLLGWDAALVFRSAQALMLALAAPATFLFCRLAVRQGPVVSLLAAVLVGLNSTIHFYVYLGHPGQTSWVFLLPVALLMVMTALESREGPSQLAAALMVSGLLVSYYSGAAALPTIFGSGFLYFMLARPPERRQTAAAAAVIGVGVLALALPDHIRFLQAAGNVALYHAAGWGSPGVAPLSDALGNTLAGVSLDLVAGKGQIDRIAISEWVSLSTAVSAVPFIFVCLGVALGKGPGMGPYRALLLGALAILEYLRLTDYGYGHVKVQSITTFLFAVALAVGIGESWRWTRRTRSFSHWLVRPTAMASVLAVAAFAVFVPAAVNTGLVAHSYWKMDRNLFNPGLWEANALNRLIPDGAATRLSPSLIGEPQTVYLTNFFLRDQQVRGPFALEWIWQRLMLLPTLDGLTTPPTSPAAPPAFEVLGASEVASAYGLLPSDRVWSGSLVKAYRRPTPDTRVEMEVRGRDPQNRSLAIRLPATVRLSPRNGPPLDPAHFGGLLVAALLSEVPAQVRFSTPFQQQIYPVGPGLDVQSVPIQVPDQVIVAPEGSGSFALLSLTWRPGADRPPLPEHYPRVLAMSGSSGREGNRIAVRFTHFDDQVPAAHSVDVFSLTGEDHSAWYSLPPLLEGRIRDISLEFDGFSLQHRLLIDGNPFDFPSSVFPGSVTDRNGQYVGYLSTTYGGTNPNRIPIFRYRLQDRQVTEFEPFPLLAAWDDSHSRLKWK